MNSIWLYSASYRYLVTGNFHRKYRFLCQKVTIAISMWFLSDKSWVTGLLHLVDVEVRVKRFEWLKSKYFPQKRKKKKKSCAKSEKMKKYTRMWMVILVCWSMSFNVEILLNSWIICWKILVEYFMFLD